MRVRNHLPDGNEEAERLEGKASESRLFAPGLCMSFSTHPRTFKEIVGISYNNIYLRNITVSQIPGR